VNVTFNGAPTFVSAFANAENGSVWINGTMTFTGSFTGPRYSVTLNGVINTGSGNVNFFPGSAAGTFSAGGQYN
jgi:hypothetical protein